MDRRLPALLAFLVVLVGQLPHVWWGEDSPIRLWDAADIHLAYHSMWWRDGTPATDDFALMLGGLPPATTSAETDGTLWVNRLVGHAYWGYVANDTLVRLVGCLGMLLLLGRLLPAAPRVNAAVAAAFGLLPWFTTHGLSIPGQPLVLWAGLVLAEEGSGRGERAGALLALAAYGLDSYLPMVGIFVLPAWGLAWAARAATGRPHRGLLVGGLVLGAAFGLANRALIVDQLAGSPTAWHREEFAFSQGHSAGHLLAIVGRVLRDSHEHAPAAPYPFVWFGLAAGLVLALRGNREGDPPRAGPMVILAVAGILAIGAVYFLVFDRWVLDLRGNVALLRKVSLHRVFWFLPTAFYLGLAGAAALGARRGDLGRALTGCLLVIQVAWILPTRQWWPGPAHPSYRAYRSEELFRAAVRDLGGDPARLRVACLGFYPVQANLAGIPTVDGYWNLYPLARKTAWRPVVAGELARSDVLRNLFETWGSRCYLFSAELGLQYLVRKGTRGPLEELRIDVPALARLGTTHVLAALPIGNARALGLVPEGTWTHPDALIDLFAYAVPRGRDATLGIDAGAGPE